MLEKIGPVKADEIRHGGKPVTSTVQKTITSRRKTPTVVIMVTSITRMSPSRQAEYVTTTVKIHLLELATGIINTNALGKRFEGRQGLQFQKRLTESLSAEE